MRRRESKGLHGHRDGAERELLHRASGAKRASLHGCIAQHAPWRTQVAPVNKGSRFNEAQGKPIPSLLQAEAQLRAQARSLPLTLPSSQRRRPQADPAVATAGKPSTAEDAEGELAARAIETAVRVCTKAPSALAAAVPLLGAAAVPLGPDPKPELRAAPDGEALPAHPAAPVEPADPDRDPESAGRGVERNGCTRSCSSCIIRRRGCGNGCSRGACQLKNALLRGRDAHWAERLAAQSPTSSQTVKALHPWL